MERRLRQILKKYCTWFMPIALAIMLLSASYAQSATFWTTLSPAEIKEPVYLTNETVARLVERLKPAVVNISVTQVIRSGGVPQEFVNPFGDDDQFGDFWKKFFGNREPREFRKKGLGSGLIINKEGYIVTNNHVVQKAREITVILSNKKQYPAKVVGVDAKLDIALIKIEAEEALQIAPLGDSDRLREGEAVLAIGNPFGLAETVTAGIVSAKGRVIGAGPYDDFIQTDASINPGNSGGPLIDYHGAVIGINTAIIASGQGIGFAVPINAVKEIIVNLKEKGKVTRGWLGVSIQEVTPELAKSFRLKDAYGALVSDVTPGSPAEKAGLKRGDVIVELNKKPIREYRELPRIVALMPPGENVFFKVLRDGKEEILSAIVEELKEGEAPQPAQELQKQMGLSLQPVTPEIAKELGLKKTEGVVITNVDANSPAAEAGLRRGDVILEANKQPVNNIKEFSGAVRKAEKSVLFLIYRSGSAFYLSLGVPEQK